MTRSLLYRAGIIAVAFCAPVLWEIAVTIALLASGYRASEITILAIAKIGFALILGGTMLRAGSARRWGFAGGLHVRRWGLLWPIWAASAISLIQDLEQTHLSNALLWLPVAFAVAIGEEGIFRGAILSNLDRRHPRRAVIVSAFLFGALHLAALATPLDARMIAAQAAAAFGLGLVLGAVRIRTRSIWPGIVAHGVLDYTGLVAVDGLAEAMAYSAGGVIYMLIGGAVAAAWGLFLCRHLQAEPAVPPIP